VWSRRGGGRFEVGCVVGYVCVGWVFLEVGCKRRGGVVDGGGRVWEGSHGWRGVWVVCVGVGWACGRQGRVGLTGGAGGGAIVGRWRRTVGCLGRGSGVTGVVWGGSACGTTMCFRFANVGGCSVEEGVGGGGVGGCVAWGGVGGWWGGGAVGLVRADRRREGRRREDEGTERRWGVEAWVCG